LDRWDNARSLHDNLLVSYAVQCKERTIVLRAERRDAGNPSELTNVVFSGVEGYHFANDAFGNIIFDLRVVTAEQILEEFGSEIAESYRAAGSPGPWAANLGSAADDLRERGIKGFILTPSCGLSGWILAKEAHFERADRAD
jgi:hypothetical protein